MSEVEQRRERLPSARARPTPGAAQRGDADMHARRRAMHGGVAEEARAAKARRSAWLLAGLALFFYVGYVAWMFIRANGG